MPRVVSAFVACLIGVGVATAATAVEPVNLVATPSVKDQLRSAFLRAHRRYAPAKVRGPLKRRTYYGRYGRKEYAVASFSVPGTGTTDQPELFRRPRGGVWRDLGDTGGDVCPPSVPRALLRLWNFVLASSTVVNGRRVYCYAPRAG